MQKITSKKNLFTRERIIGFVLYFAVSATLFVAKVFFSDADTDFPAVVIYFATSALLFLALFGLWSLKYKQYAQGAVVGWLGYFVASMGQLFI